MNTVSPSVRDLAPLHSAVGEADSIASNVNAKGAVDHDCTPTGLVSASLGRAVMPSL